MFRRAPEIILTILTCCSVMGCGPSKPNIDEDAVLKGLGFYDPVVVSAPLTWNDGLFALFQKAGYVSIIPNTNRQPWWAFGDQNGAPIVGGPVQVAVGHRVVTGHSDEKIWSNGAQDQYAITVTYSIELDPRLVTLTNLHPGGYTLRLVLINDPAVGKWEISRDATRYGISDSDDMAQRLASAGQQFVNDVPSRVSEAINQADELVGRTILDQTGISTLQKDSEVLISSKSKVAYLRDLTDLPNGATLHDARAYCLTKQNLGLSWRLATYAEIAAVVAQVNGWSRLDTPNGRFWGKELVNPSEADNQPLKKLIVDTFQSDIGLVDHPLDASVFRGIIWHKLYRVFDTGGITADTEAYGPYGPAFDDAKIAWNNGGETPTRTYAMCVAELNQSGNPAVHPSGN